MDVDTALRTADVDRGNGPKSVALDVLAAELRRLRAIEERAQEIANAEGDHVRLSDRWVARDILRGRA